ncbi:polyprenyl synthetase family protein [Nonomuraea sp. NPDC048826]|uniref:polyprenyl synthetase family protein n=1 Tax=Nonomuraea sp. NPDC048826 TaxID=3364347 RepID=UPI00371AADE4
MIARCRRLFEPALREAVSVLHPWSARMAGFTLGWADADGRPYEGNAGKSVRPAIALLCAEAAGADPGSAVPAAVAVELVHAFSLVHDDIIDHDEQRRHRPALWKVYGTGPALLAGDALLALAVAQLARSGEAMTYLSSALVELVQGQTADMAFEGRPWRGPGAVTADEYTEMTLGKTGGLLGAAAATGVILGGRADLAARMWQMGRELGVAFQLADDILGIWGDPTVTGKPADSDLRRGKKTYPVLAALATDSVAARELATLLSTGATDDRSVRRAARLVEEAGGRAEAETLADRYLSSALDTMNACLPHATDLRTLCGSLIDRIH